jgi:hypothetical protein
MSFLSYPMSEIKGLHYRAQLGDDQARSFFMGLFAADAACWLCDQPITPEGRIAVFPDPKQPEMAILAAECVECCTRDDRKAREIAVMRSMWPGVKFARRKDLVPGYLRGSRPKPRRGSTR